MNDGSDVRFSVLISVYRDDVPAYLDKALCSIWTDQTRKPDQIVLVQDGPLSSGLSEVIEEWKLLLGDFLSILALESNVGLGAALNNGLKACQFELIARMDSDDVALADRFARQLGFMCTHPKISASSGTIEEWDEELTEKLSERRLPQGGTELVSFAKRRSPLNHPAVMFRKSAVESVGGYPPFRKSQDYALWSLLLVAGHDLANLSDVLLKMRAGHTMMARRGFSHFKGELEVLQFQKKLGFLSIKDFLINASLRAILRVMPSWAKVLVYRLAR